MREQRTAGKRHSILNKLTGELHAGQQTSSRHVSVIKLKSEVRRCDTRNDTSTDPVSKGCWGHMGECRTAGK